METKPLSLVFAGTPDFAVHGLRALFHDKRFSVDLVLTQADKPIGRKKILTPTPVKQFALSHKIPCESPEKLKEVREILEKKSYDMLVVIAYGKILPDWMLALFPFSVNVHGSLLPKHRGASPVQESILSGDTLTGISVMKMVSEMDAGPVYFFHTLEVHYDDTAEDVFLGLSRITEENLGDDLLHIFSGAKAEEQDHTNASFCHKITREDGEISFAKNTAEEIWRKYKAFFPWPGIFYFSKNGKRVKILKGKPHASQGIPCKEGFFLPEIIIEEGKRAKNF